MSTGRPTKLDQPVRVEEDGTVVTAAEHLVAAIRLGLDLQSAADTTGISRATLHNWRLKGARLRAEEAQGKRELTDGETKFARFVDNLEKAEAEFEADQLKIVEGSAEGGYKVTKITEQKDKAGEVVSTTTVVETARPQWQAAAWVLERRLPAKYARRVEVTGAEGTPLVPRAQQAKDLADQLRALQTEDDAKPTT